MIKRIALALLALLLLLAAAVAVNTLRRGSRQIVVPAAPPIAVDEAGVAGRLAGAVRFKTVSSQDDAQLNADEFRKLHAYLEQRFPRVHATLERERIAGLSLLYRWRGSDPNALPILLMAHQDVVPIASGTEPGWSEAPFSGAIKDGFVWGRGAWDDKGNLIAQLEAIEMLIASGFAPRRTVYLAYGADEEVGGLRGAVEIAKTLKERNVRFEFVLDEGLLITEGIMNGLREPVALIGVAEKGILSLRLEADGTPGHSSMPGAASGNVIALMSGALLRVQQQPMPARLSGVARAMFETVAPGMGGFSRVALSNLWLFGPVVRAQLEKSPGTDAMLRTTTALTMFHAGNQENVIPGHAEAALNFRLLPGDTIDAVRKHVETAIADDRIRLSVAPFSVEASRVSDPQSASYRMIERTVRSCFPDVIVAPGLMVGGTDSRHFGALSDHIYRFSPVRATADDLKRFHGTDERISIANLAELVRFYVQLVRNVQVPPG